MKKLLKKILLELREIRNLLLVAVNDKEQRVTYRAEVDARELARSVLPSIHGKARQGSER